MKKFKISLFYIVIIAAFTISSIALVYYRETRIKNITISDLDKTYEIKTYDLTVEEALEACSIILSEYDEVIPTLETKIETGMNIQINRSYGITIHDGLEKKEIYTTHYTVREVLEEQNIELGALDVVQPFVDGKISPGENISITRVRDEFVSESYQIPYLTEINLVNNLDDTETIVIQDGELGVKSVNYRLRYENDELISRNIINEVVVKDPVNEIKNKGTEDLFVTSRGVPFRYSKVIVCQSTAYDLSYASCGKYPGEPGYGITYLGTQARPGVIAVDPSVIPLGSNVYVESMGSGADYGFAVAEDTGSAIKGNKVDLFISSHTAAMRYGRRNVRIYILEDDVESEYIKGFGY
ncbi:MAG: G5 domain-containing protein [Clostridia bacterium]|nr:G5 domain-containing protein [Clostridia bacterium]